MLSKLGGLIVVFSLSGAAYKLERGINCKRYVRLVLDDNNSIKKRAIYQVIETNNVIR